MVRGTVYEDMREKQQLTPRHEQVKIGVIRESILLGVRSTKKQFIGGNCLSGTYFSLLEKMVVWLSIVFSMDLNSKFSSIRMVATQFQFTLLFNP